MKRLIPILIILLAPALALSKEALRPSQNAVFHNNQGISYYTKGELDKAEFEFKTAIELSPDYAEAYSNLGLIYKIRGQLELAKKYFEIATQKNKKYASAFNHLGATYLAMGKPDVAIGWIERALKIEPTFADAHYNLGLCYLEKARLSPNTEFTKKAEKHLKEASILNPNLPLVHKTLGDFYLQLGDLEHAIIRYRLAVEADPEDSASWSGLGNAYLRKGDPQTAQKCFDKALEQNAGSPDAHMQLGLSYMKEGKFTVAVEEFKRVTAANPKDDRGFYQLGTAYLSLADGKRGAGREKEAVKYYNDALTSLQTAVSLNPSHPDAHYNLGLASYRLGDNTSAEQEWARVLSKDPNHPRALHNLGMLYYNQNKTKEANEKMCQFVKSAGGEFTSEVNAALQIIEKNGGKCRR